MKSCLIVNCSQKYHCKGYCRTHYQRVRRGKDPTVTKRNINPPPFCSIFGCNRPHDSKGLCTIHYNREYNRTHPHSNTAYSYDLQDAMNNARIRDKNTCQWYGCGLSHREVPIQVHHIFPVSEYPELELVEEYMICYCANHHGLWHRYRGDKYWNLIKTKEKSS